jgi:hypothetical protein
MQKRDIFSKVIIFFSSFVLLLLLTDCSSSENQNNTDDTLQGGYNLAELNSYGEWVQINNYGNVWHPYVVYDWMPYDNGHWAYADGNWTWISYEPFGWIVYHYGYWYEDPFYGWVWMPSDGVWSPARVLWVDYDDYIGWAPIPPLGVIYGNPWEMKENHHWHVVRHKDFTEDNIINYRIKDPVRNEPGAIDVINKPPDKSEIEKYVGKSIPEIKLQHENITLPPKQIKRMNLPPQEEKRVEQNSPRVKKEVLVPSEDFHKQQNEKNNHKK